VAPSNLSAIGTLHRAMAPSTFTYGSHAAMFVGFTPGVFDRQEPYVNPKFGRIFKLRARGVDDSRAPWALLDGHSIIDGFKRLGYRAFGSGGVNWFNPSTATAKMLIADFHDFYFSGRKSLTRQVAWHLSRIEISEGQPLFAFLNVGETHVPYSYEGAPWPDEVNPCRPFALDNDAAECRRRQSACLDFADQTLAPLLDAFRDATTFVCADHGDAWGEHGLWEHGIHHPKVHEVPLVFRLGIPHERASGG
jgi:hypothetical protein